MRNRILYVSTCSELDTYASEISKEFGLNLHIYNGGIMKNGHIYAQENQDSYDVVISQGGTAAAIKELVSTPVVAVEMRMVNFLKGLNKAGTYGKKAALLVFESDYLTDIDKVKGMLGIDFTIFPYKTKKNLRDQINKVISLGISTLVGMGDCILEIGREHNINAVVIHSEMKELRKAFISAKNICDFARKEKEKAEIFKMIVDHSGDGIVALDNNRRILTFNPTAERIFNLNADNVIERSIKDIFNKNLIEEIYGNGEMLLDKLVQIDDKQFLMNKLPIIIDKKLYDIVITFQEISKLQKLEQKVRTQLYKKGLTAKYTFADICGNSKIIMNTIARAKLMSKTDTTVLITGETGTGKELFAQSIHNSSARRLGPFVAVNCAAVPESLLESELFGYEEGAFTGARKGGKPGLFELAHRGTIFLDEVSEIPLSLQGRLLRVLQEREVLRIGGDYILNVDIRVIAATNTNLFKLVKEGKFRQDLYFRLNIMDLRLPSLRERKSDIPILLKNFIDKMNIKHHTNTCSIEDEAMAIIENYDWYGNVRELENFAEKICVLSNNSIINKKLVKQLLYPNNDYDTAYTEIIDSSNNQTISISLGNIKDIERQVIEQASIMYEGNKEALADILGISRTTLWKRLKEIERPNS